MICTPNLLPLGCSNGEICCRANETCRPTSHRRPERRAAASHAWGEASASQHQLSLTSFSRQTAGLVLPRAETTPRRCVSEGNEPSCLNCFQKWFLPFGKRSAAGRPRGWRVLEQRMQAGVRAQSTPGLCHQQSRASLDGEKVGSYG